MSKPVPHLVIFGPDKKGALYTVDARGDRRPLFTSTVRKGKPQLEMSRVLPGGQYQPFSSATISSLSGTITYAIHGEEIKMKVTYEGLQLRRPLMTPVGELAWRPMGWGNGMELWDKAGVMIARYKYLKLSGDPPLEIFVQLQDPLLELVVTSAVSLLVDETKNLKLVGEIMGMAGG